MSATGAKVAGPVSYLRGSSDRAPGRQRLRRGVPICDLGDQDLHRGAAVGLVRRRRRTNVGTLTTLDLRDRGVSGRLISVTLIGSAGTKKVSGDVFRSVFNAGRPSADPMMRSTLVATAPIP